MAMERLTISKNGRYFERDGKPFFWLGDTAWLLFAKLTPEEKRVYLQNRAAKGFTVIQATLVHEKGYCDTQGRFALVDDDFSQPCPNGYWRGVRDVVEFAAGCGLSMALLPAWGSFVKEGLLNLENAEGYAAFLAEQFGGYANVLWLVGGDVRGSDAPEVFDLIGRTLRRLCPNQLIGYHPFGRTSSSMYFHDCAWLDFNTFQSGHRDYTQRKLNAWDDANREDYWFGEDNFLYVLRDRAMEPAKPTLDGEPSYEFIPHGLHDSSKPYWQAYDVRRYAYWSLLAGSAGHTYGDNAIMQFHRYGDKADYGALQTWDVALHNPGGGQMRHARRLMVAIAWHTGESAQDLLAGAANLSEHAQVRVMRTSIAVCAYAYEGKPFALDTSGLRYLRVMGGWFDPVSGAFSPFGEVERGDGVRFIPPDRRCGQNDWALVLWNGDGDAPRFAP